MVITINNPDISGNIKTSLSQDYSSGTSLTVDSSVSFASGQYILVGEPGLENSEITNLTAAPSTNTTMTVSALKFSHPRGEPIYYLLWDKYSLNYDDGTGWAVYG